MTWCRGRRQTGSDVRFRFKYVFLSLPIGRNQLGQMVVHHFEMFLSATNVPFLTVSDLLLSYRTLAFIMESSEWLYRSDGDQSEVTSVQKTKNDVFNSVWGLSSLEQLFVPSFATRASGYSFDQKSLPSIFLSEGRKQMMLRNSPLSGLDLFKKHRRD